MSPISPIIKHIVSQFVYRTLQRDVQSEFDWDLGAITHGTFGFLEFWSKRNEIDQELNGLDTTICGARGRRGGGGIDSVDFLWLSRSFLQDLDGGDGK